MKKDKTNKSQKGAGWLIFIILAVLVLAGLYYYIALPAINIHNPGLWKFAVLAAIVLFLFCAAPHVHFTGNRMHPVKISTGAKTKAFKLSGILAIVLLAAYFIGTLLSSQIFNASRYQKLMTVKKSEFTKDIDQISYDQIPLLDRDSATILGERKMGSLVDLASQFEVASEYTQINYKNNPVRVTPLRYASLIKWFTNRKNGIPAYIKIDMATQQTKLVRLDEGMKYTPYDHFGRNLYRHLRFKYPTYLFDDISFEINDQGVPYWVCSVKKYNIGLFGGQTISRVVLCNAITGECKDYKVEDAPKWIDQVYSAEMLTTLYNYHGILKHGFLNSILGQKDCLTTTNGYNYLAIKDDVWVYTGVTSITSDQSNVGFVLMNQRTMETRYYEIEGAIEDSAMTSAEGKVQNLGYKATFPLLLNIDSEPTYFMALKDSSGLVKKYAMVNVHNYQIVATGDSVNECEEAYRGLMQTNGIETDKGKSGVSAKEISGKIRKIAQGVIDGNSHYYIVLEGSDSIFDVDISKHLDAILLEEGDQITLKYNEGKTENTVSEISR
ncbi:MAG: CvpA family protein [Eubacterium sp.]|nr:CvpA family protein [Eubacterium sp.]MDY5496930.1 CvpA family protein [Anaerobutyricum sp.]